MSIDLNVNENINMIFEKLENFLKSKTVVGESIKIGETTIIPFLTVTFGLGSGGGDGKDPKGANGTGSGAGVGARVAPTAVLVVKGDDVQLLPIKKTGGLDKLIEMVPDIVSHIKCDKAGDTEENK
ncbi:MAG TPA: spore germination protein GerW family protein [Pseudobacteroides sp.]|uniref:GerW family sporulation protein n=1 Tax=Pseudobacteroides sp. TaxID=1968840 RepID=UPI002F94B12F